MAAWPQIRAAVLHRDDYKCQIRAVGCTQRATQADHIIKWNPDPTKGGSWLGMHNLRAACAHCNNSIAHRKSA